MVDCALIDCPGRYSNPVLWIRLSGGKSETVDFPIISTHLSPEEMIGTFG